MSRSQKKESSKPTCKHCMQSGEPKSVYESHVVRDFKGRVCCPKILSNVCSRCYKIGHLKTYCTVVLKETAELCMVAERVSQKTTAARFASISKPEAKPINKFDALAESDSDSEIVERVQKKKTAPKKNLANMNWADYETDEEE